MSRIAAILGSALCYLVGSNTVNAAALPSEIQNCISSAVCSTPVPVQQGATYSAYTYSDGGIDKFLFEYGLWPSSNESSNFETTQLSGAAWLSASAIYDLTQEQHFFTLYLDQVTPTPTNLWGGDSDGLDVGLSMPTSDLLAGSSFFRLGLLEYGGLISEGNLGTHGNLDQFEGQSFFPCAAATCEVGAELNLLNIQYIQSGPMALLTLNPTDQRGLLYSQYQDYGDDDTWYRSQSYEVVPIPAAAWLFGSALLGLGVIKRRKA